MKILFIGGTRFVGRHMVETAVAGGHDVTVFHRGQTGGQSTPGVETILGDRTKDLDLLDGREWDAAIDSCGYFPEGVKASAQALKGRVKRYLFVSTVSVYQPSYEPTAEDGALSEPFDGMPADEITGESYGPLKVLCEREVQKAFGDQAIILRPGLVVGPGDYTDRFTYWPFRIREGGDVLAADLPGYQWQFIDGRDLGKFAVSLVENASSGVFNATGPDTPTTMLEVLEHVRAIVNPEARLTWVSPKFLQEAGVQEWSDLPFVLLGNGPTLNRNIDKALSHGLKFRALTDTVRDLLAWKDAQPGKGLATGLSAERQEQLIAEWRTQSELHR